MEIQAKLLMPMLQRLDNDLKEAKKGAIIIDVSLKQVFV
jgi:hypothetical protein